MEAPGSSRPQSALPRGEAVPLKVRGREVAEYVWRPQLPVYASPRPFLHPVRTLDGSPVTEACPSSHLHQLGISMAAPDIEGRNFWGGRTFVAGHGPAWLDDHGVQQHQRWLRREDGRLRHLLHWFGADRATLLRETRTLTFSAVTETAWVLGFGTRLTNAVGHALTVRSPASQGRIGAGYGGFFWRGPSVDGPVRVLSPDGPGVAAVHGRTADWVAVGAGGDRPWTVVFTPADDTTAGDRWFVRARDYLGVGSSLTWDRPLTVEVGETIARRLLVVVADGELSEDEAAGFADVARSAS